MHQSSSLIVSAIAKTLEHHDAKLALMEIINELFNDYGPLDPIISIGTEWCFAQINVKFEIQSFIYTKFKKNRSDWIIKYNLWDVNCCPASVIDAIKKNKPVLFIFDMDSTLIQNECIEELADLAGVRDQVCSLTSLAMAGNLDFRESLLRRLTLIGSLSAIPAYNHIIEKIQWSPGALELAAQLNRFPSVHTAIVSGGFTPIVQFVREKLGFSVAMANELAVDDNGKLTGRLKDNTMIVDAQGKATILKKLAQELNIEPGRVIAVGDGANDLLMVEAANPFGVGYGPPKDVLAKTANIILNYRLDWLLPTLGINHL